MTLQLVDTPKAFIPDETNTRLLRDAFGHFATGVTIVTAAFEGKTVAITANSFSSVSLSPPLVLWSPDKNSRRFSYFEKAEHYAIHVLSADQDELCWKVAKDIGGLNELNLAVNSDGVPILDGCLARFECERKAIYDGGDHAIVLGQVTRAVMGEGREALTFFKGRMGRIAAN